MSPRPAWLLAAVLSTISLARAEPLVITGEVSAEGGSFVRIPFTVPSGTTEIEIKHDNLTNGAVLDWGLRDPDDTFRGWGGGNSENIVINEAAASRSYLPGAIKPGEWSLILGKAKLGDTPAQYRIEIELRTTPQLAAQTDRRPYAPVAPLKTEARWYAGDFHVHSRESGDASATLDEIATLAKQQKLDFVAISDHNTTSHLDYLGTAQGRHPDVLFLPSVEFTTYAGHANGIGATQRVDHEFGIVQPKNYDVASAAVRFQDQGAIFSINHPALDLNACIGCAWKHSVPPDLVGAVEIATGGWTAAGQFFVEPSIAFWESLLTGGRHIPAIGGSDDHTAGKSTGPFSSSIGQPTTMVFAKELSHEGILQAIREGRTVVKLQDANDPMVTITSADGAWMIGDTVEVGPLGPASTELIVKVTGAADALRFIHNGEEVSQVPVTSDPFEYRLTVPKPGRGEEPHRWRAAAIKDDHLATVTSYIWVQGNWCIDCGVERGCGCTAASSSAVAVVGVVLLALRRRRSSSAIQ